MLAIIPLLLLLLIAYNIVVFVTGPELATSLFSVDMTSGAVWTFMWERAEMRIEDSVRESAYFGFHRTRQIVLEALASETTEVSWIFTLEEH